MHIVYVVDADLSASFGVAKKIGSQIEMWKKYGNTVECFCIGDVGGIANVRSVEFARLNAGFIPKSLIRYINRVKAYQKLVNYIEDTKPDLLYVRQSIWVPFFGKMLSILPSVIELNSDDLFEKSTLGFFAWVYCKITREILIKKSSGFVAVSDEIAKSYVKYSKPMITVSNGFEILELKSNSINKKKRTQMIFVGSPGQSWQGTDKVLKLAKMFPEYDFHIIGDVHRGISKNIFYYGVISGDELAQLYLAMDVGIGTLALHRKLMNEASPLKVREYLAYGLPVILGYKDTDVDGESFVLNIGNYEANVDDNRQQIINFVKEWSGKRVAQEKVVELINWEPKELQRLQFFKRVIKNAS